MAETNSISQDFNIKNNCDLFESSSLSSRSSSRSSSLSNWRIQYKPIPKKCESKGVWDGYESRDEFITMHLR